MGDKLQCLKLFYELLERYEQSTEFVSFGSEYTEHDIVAEIFDGYGALVGIDNHLAKAPFARTGKQAQR